MPAMAALGACDGSGGRAELTLCLWLSTSYFFMFVAYVAAQTLASTLPVPPPASGTVAISIVYWAFAFSSLWSPLLVHRVGAKACIQASFAMYGTFIAAWMYPRWWTLYPGAAMVGLAASPLWVSQGILITHFAQVYARRRGEEDASAHVGYFNGIFQCFLVLTGVAGNLMSSIVFDMDRKGKSTGASATAAVPQSTVFLLFSIYLLCVVIAIVCAAWNLPTTATVEAERVRYNLVVDGAEKLPTLWTTFNIMKQPRMLLMLPIFGAMGWIYSFVSADFTKGVIEPVLGERAIGAAMAVFYVACAVVSISVGRISDLVGRPTVICFSALLLYITLAVLKWQQPTSALAVYVLAVVIGAGLQSLRTPLAAQMSANYCDDIEAAFAATEMVTSIVGALGYLAATRISLDAKLDVAAVACAFGFACYYLESSMRGVSSNDDEGGGGSSSGKPKARAEARLARPPPLGARLCDQLLFQERRRAGTAS